MSTQTVALRNDATITYRDKDSGRITGHAVFNQQSEYWYDEKPDRMRMRKTSGWLYPKSYDRRVIRRTTPHGKILVDYSIYETLERSGVLNEVVVAPDDLAPEEVWITDAAFISALTKLKDQKVNLGVALAEARQTANFVGSTASRIARGANYLANGDWRRAASTLGASWRKAPNTWLELQYAAKPFMSDVHGAMSELARADPGNFAVTVKGTMNDNIEKTVTYNDGTIYGSSCDIRTLHGAFCRLDFLPNNAFLAAIARSGLSNPAEVIWEKIPYSFVVDWFYTVGDSLSALDATEGFQFLSGSMTRRRETIVSVSPSPSGGPTVLSRSFEGRSRHFKLQRTPITEVPQWVAPRIKNPVSLGHLANGLSLLATAWRDPKLHKRLR